MNAEQDFLKLCTLFGACSKRSQGAGGNISVKQANTLWIKASGYRLTAVTKTSGYVKCHIPTLQELYQKNIETFEESIGGKPSMESFFHLLPKSHIVHIHPTFFCKYLCSIQSKAIFTSNHFPNSLYVPYVKPGLPLAKSIFPHYTNESVIFLENHGIILLSDSVESMIELYETSLATLEQIVGTNANQSSLSVEYKLTQLFNQTVKPIYTLPSLPNFFSPISPDHFLFLQPQPFLTAAKTVEHDCQNWLAENKAPSVVQVDNQVYCLALSYDLCTNKEEYLRSYLEIDSTTTILTLQDQQDLLTCPKENHRLNSLQTSNLLIQQVQ
jgi:ribulose-5-phosphate 4-epimerase/fuculose-1-phosphate aldolase